MERIPEKIMLQIVWKYLKIIYEYFYLLTTSFRLQFSSVWSNFFQVPEAFPFH
jgi:hypothetical protein